MIKDQVVQILHLDEFSKMATNADWFTCMTVTIDQVIDDDIIIPHETIIATHHGSINDNIAHESYLKIRPEYTGRGLCKQFVKFTYQKLLWKK